eukprot:1143747-Pelagomonas_calceolata.AAC.3
MEKEILTQRAASFPHYRVKGKLMWAWWVSGGTRPQGTRIIMSVFVFSSTSAWDKFVRAMHRMGMEFLCKFVRPPWVNP